jgi:superfamily II DNA/RNA helicase
MEVLTSMGIDTPTPIQALSIGPVLDGKDVIAKAETGTGKTLAFGAPMMARIDPARSSVLGLVLCPTRELSEQVFQVLVELGRARGVKVALIVGGEPMHPQVEALQNGGQVVVGTPGRVLDLMNQGFLSFPWTDYVVLEEADKMLEIGFIDYV